MDKFEVGEVVVIQSQKWPELNGTETIILSIADYSWLNHPDGITGYVCSIQKKTTGWWESALRKKKPPEEPATWQEIQQISGWNPTKEGVL